MPPKKKKVTVSGSKEEGEEQKHVTITITDGDKSYRLRSDELGPGDDLVARQQTGYPVGHFLENFSSDSMVVVIWMARRKSGEPNLGFQNVMSKYPTYASFSKLDAEIVYDGEGEDDDSDDGDGPLADDD